MNPASRPMTTGIRSSPPAGLSGYRKWMDALEKLLIINKLLIKIINYGLIAKHQYQSQRSVCLREEGITIKQNGCHYQVSSNVTRCRSTITVNHVISGYFKETVQFNPINHNIAIIQLIQFIQSQLKKVAQQRKPTGCTESSP